MSSINASRHALDGKKRNMLLYIHYTLLSKHEGAIENKDNFGKSHVPCESYGKIGCSNKVGISFTEMRFPAIDVMVTLNPWCLRIAITFHRNYFHAPF